ncbi:MAG: Fic family protein [Clostridia bacterium]|nr:Fic family protein [Clostridia bacterium]
MKYTGKIVKQQDLKRCAFARKFDQLAHSLQSENGLKLYDDKEIIAWINPKAKHGSKNLNFYAFDRIDYSELNTFLNNLALKEARLKALGYDLGGVKSFNRNVWIDLSRESSAIEGIMDDFPLDLSDFRTHLRGRFTIEPSTENFNKNDYFEKLYAQYEMVKKDNDSVIINGNKKSHTLKISTIAHFIAFKYVYKCAKLNRGKGDLSAEDFETVLKNASSLMSGNYAVSYRNDPAAVTGAEWRPAKPAEIYDKMKALSQWMVDDPESSRLHPIEKAALFHAEFIRIHPFADGNGRTGRIMANYVLIKNEIPTIAVRYRKTEDYFAALNKAITTHEADDLIEMFYKEVYANAKKIDECLDWIEKNKNPQNKDRDK